ncbi:protealysin inhibitor emfourin [Massilia sp. SR12]
MKITASGGGGFAGLLQHFEVDTATSPAGPALEAALVSVGFFGAEADENSVIGADLGRWTITADDGRQRHSLSFVETGAPPWQDLLDLIRSAA